jgi:hypothetical protein
MGTQSSSTFPPPLTKPSDNIDSICTIQKMDGRVYMDNIVFHNFKYTYTNLPECSRNSVFS